MDVLTIGQLAERAGVHVETVRYYERRRLLREPPRTRSGYRQYAASDLWRLQFIARAKRLGFTLAEIADLLGATGVGEPTGDPTPAGHGGAADDVVRLARSKMRELDHQQRELAETRARLERLIDVCADPDSEDCTALRVTNERLHPD